MKIGLITYHAAHNYGSFLQAFATQEKLKTYGYDVEIINYRTREQKISIRYTNGIKAAV